MIKKIITEISEEDFRKLDLTVYRTKLVDDKETKRYDLVPVKINDILDAEIEQTIESGYESDLLDLKTPVTIAIHEEPTQKDYEEFCNKWHNKHLSREEAMDMCRRSYTYLDKFINRYTGAQTFQFSWGIKHLYSTRDYYESRDDYWRVRKDETRVIYRINLSSKWLEKFVLKHKEVAQEWQYNQLPKGVSPDYEEALLCINYDLEDGEFKEHGRYGRFVYKHCEYIIPVDENGNTKEPSWKKNN